MLRCSRGLRNAASNAHSTDEAATAIVGYLHSQSADPVTLEPQCALVRFYRTASYRDLDPSVQAFAASRLGVSAPDPAMKVLSLTATVGIEPQWCDPGLSVDHRAIPLPSVEIVEQAPMIAELIRAMGIEIADVVSPPIALFENADGRTYNVFHVEHARGSPFIPAQSGFVIPYGIESVVGFGGLLSTGEFFAVVMFSRVHIGKEPASRFRNVALDVKAILYPLVNRDRAARHNR